VDDESFLHDGQGIVSEERIVRRSLTGIRKSKGKTDWARVDALTEDELEAAIASDPDADIDWSEAELVVPPKKQPISIRLDEDVIDWFRRSGPGYQTRINAVLRHYMEHKTSA
jgi:uncharacterized protein (DUF4415 family)